MIATDHRYFVIKLIRIKKYNIVALNSNSPIFVEMYRIRHQHTRQLTTLLLMAVMTWVHVAKAFHTHAPYSTDYSCQQENVITEADTVHSSCTICEFQLAKDVSFTGEAVLVAAPVYAAPTYSRLITAINPDRLFITESRGPPRA